MRIFILLIFFICPSITIIAQNKSLDSLKNIHKSLPNDTTKVHFLLSFAEKAWQQGEYNQAIKLCEEGLVLANKLQFKQGIGNISHRLGTLYIDKGNYELALSSLLEAVKIRENLKDNNNLARSLSNIGALYQDRKDYKQALVYSERALEIFKNINEKYAISLLTGNIGHLYTLQKDYEKGLNYLNQAVILKKEIEDLQGLTYIYNYIGHNYLQRNNTKKALTYYLLALEIEEKANAVQLMVASYANIGGLYFSIKDYTNARKYAEKALSLSQKTGARLQLSEIYINFVRLDSAQNNFKSAFEWYKKHRALNDSLNNVETNKKMLELQTTFEVTKKENEIISLSKETEIQKLELEQRNWLLLGLSIFIVIFAFASYVFYKNRQVVAKYNLLQTEQQVYRLQMNPHFFFNALVAIQDFVVQADGLKASSYISKFARLMRQTLEQSQQEFTSVSSEIETIKYYLDLQQLRFSGKFQYEITVDENLEIDDLQIPIMLMQPVIENAIEHGLKESGLNGGDKGKITISFSQKANKNVKNIAENGKISENLLQITISDNGIGRNKASQINVNTINIPPKHNSMATKILASRKELLQKQANFNLEIEIIDKSIETHKESGTIVCFSMPLKYQ